MSSAASRPRSAERTLRRRERRSGRARRMGVGSPSAFPRSSWTPRSPGLSGPALPGAALSRSRAARGSSSMRALSAPSWLPRSFRKRIESPSPSPAAVTPRAVLTCSWVGSLERSSATVGRKSRSPRRSATSGESRSRISSLRLTHSFLLPSPRAIWRGVRPSRRWRSRSASISSLSVVLREGLFLRSRSSFASTLPQGFTIAQARVRPLSLRAR